MTAISIGAFVLCVVVLLIVIIYIYTCGGRSTARQDGFQVSDPRKLGPKPVGLSGSAVEEDSKPGTLSHAPNGYIAEDAPILLEDPVSTKASAAQLQALLEDMRAFRGFELPYLAELGDPNVQMPISTFRGQFQELLDESKALAQNPGINSHVTLGQLDLMRANLTYLQKSYRSFGLPLQNGAFPSSRVEGFDGEKGSTGGGSGTVTNSSKATLVDLNTAANSIADEILSLQSAGSSDPVVLTRIKLFTQLQTTMNGIITKVTNGTIHASDIPLTKADLQDFLPSTTKDTSGSSIGSLDTSSVASLYQSLFGGSSSSSGSPLCTISNDVLKGLAISLTVTYDGSQIGSSAQQAASAATAQQAAAQPLQGLDSSTVYNTVDPLQNGSGGARGEFDSMVQRFSGADPKDTLGKLDWKERAKTICDRVKSAGLDPADYGCLGEEAQVGPNYSWRGHAKMVCARLDTNAIEGTSQTMGCPPVDWKGWRS